MGPRTQQWKIAHPRCGDAVLNLYKGTQFKARRRVNDVQRLPRHTKSGRGERYTAPRVHRSAHEAPQSMHPAPQPLFRHSVDSQRDVCARACEHCAALSDHTLHADPGYRNSIEPFTEDQLALISFASVCRLTAAALREARADMGEMTSWCWQECQHVAERFSNDARMWRRFEAAIRNCSSLCASIASRSRNGYRIRATATDAWQSSARRGL